MAIYVTLYKFTEQGVKNIKDSPARVDAASKAIDALGGKLIGAYYLMGEYDLIAIADAPNDDVAMTFAVGLGLAGNVRSTTLKGFTKDHFAEILKKLP